MHPVASRRWDPTGQGGVCQGGELGLRLGKPGEDPSQHVRWGAGSGVCEHRAFPVRRATPRNQRTHFRRSVSATACAVQPRGGCHTHTHTRSPDLHFPPAFFLIGTQEGFLPGVLWVRVSNTNRHDSGGMCAKKRPDLLRCWRCVSLYLHCRREYLSDGRNRPAGARERHVLDHPL